jgi:sugar lactone lactonase YvrE
MTSHLRIRPVLALLAGAALASGVLAGCGSQFTLPTENRENRSFGTPGSYQLTQIWMGMSNVKDILLTPSGELYIVTQRDGRGVVHRYPQSGGLNDSHVPQPLGTTFAGVINPTAICFGGNHLFVLDQGDTSAARSDFSCLYTAEYTADVDTAAITLQGFSRPITNLSRYWHVREYQLDGKPLSSFSDTTFAWVTGIAADASGRVYVGGLVMYCDVDPYNDHVRTLEYRYRVRRYLKGGTPDRFVTDENLPCPWHKDLDGYPEHYRVLEGTGFGSTKDPQGMQWATVTGPALYFADMGNNQVQKYADPVGGWSSFKLDIGGAGPDSMLLSQPVDVAVDSAGCVYLVDAGNRRVLRYNPDGGFIQRVDRTPKDSAAVVPYLVQPSAVAADNRQVYIADRGAGMVLHYWRLD